MRRSLPLLVLPLLALLAGCFCQEMVTKVTWLPDEGRFQVERALINIQKDGLECEGVEACVEKVKAFVADPASFDDVVGSLAEDVQVTLARSGDRLDATVRWSTPEDTRAAPGTNVFLEEEGKPGKEKPHLLVFVGGASEDSTGVTQRVEVEGKVRRRFIWYADKDDTAPQRFEVWSLHPKIRTVTLRSTLTPDARPLLQEVPGLAEALVAAGLLAAVP